MCNLGREEESKNRAFFLNYATSTSLSPMGRLVSCVDEKGSLRGVISDSVLLERAVQISTASLFLLSNT